VAAYLDAVVPQLPAPARLVAPTPQDMAATVAIVGDDLVRSLAPGDVLILAMARNLLRHAAHRGGEDGVMAEILRIEGALPHPAFATSRAAHARLLAHAWAGVARLASGTPDGRAQA
jgi:hypothetical protein